MIWGYHYFRKHPHTVDGETCKESWWVPSWIHVNTVDGNQRFPAFSNKPVEGKVVYFQEQFAPETRPSQKENSSSNPSVSGG